MRIFALASLNNIQIPSTHEDYANIESQTRGVAGVAYGWIEFPRLWADCCLSITPVGN
jgi:hypothetical protein